MADPDLRVLIGSLVFCVLLATFTGSYQPSNNYTVELNESLNLSAETFTEANKGGISQWNDECLQLYIIRTTEKVYFIQIPVCVF